MAGALAVALAAKPTVDTVKAVATITNKLNEANDLINNPPKDIINTETGEPHFLERKKQSNEALGITAEALGTIFDNAAYSYPQSKALVQLEKKVLEACK